MDENLTMALVPVEKRGISQFQNPSVMAAVASAKAEIEAAFIWAELHPRKEDEARIIIEKQCERPAFAEKVEYSIPFGKEKATGPSIRLAEEILRNWKNMKTDTAIVYNDAEVQHIKITVTDLETNNSETNTVEVSKYVERSYNRDGAAISERKNSKGNSVFTVPATPIEFKAAKNSEKSKAKRSMVLALLPPGLVEGCLEIARKTLREHDRKDPEGSRQKMLKLFASKGVFPQEISKYLGHDVSFVSPEELQTLREIWQSLEEGIPWSDFQIEEAEFKVSTGETPIQKTKREMKEKMDAPQPEVKIDIKTLKAEFVGKMREAGFDPKTDSVDFIKQVLDKDPKAVSLTEENYGELIRRLQVMIDKANEIKADIKQELITDEPEEMGIPDDKPEPPPDFKEKAIKERDKFMTVFKAQNPVANAKDLVAHVNKILGREYKTGKELEALSFSDWMELNIEINSGGEPADE